MNTFMRNKPYLVGLETASAYRFGIWSRKAAAFTCWRFSIFLFLLPVFFLALASLNHMIAFAGLLYLAFSMATVYILWKYYILGTGWVTDESSITAYGAFKSVRMEWDQITEARMETLLGISCYALKTGKQTIKIPHLNTSPGIRLSASIWQHLNKHNKAGSIWLPNGVEKLWNQDVCDESIVEWTLYGNYQKFTIFMFCLLLTLLLAVFYNRADKLVFGVIAVLLCCPEELYIALFHHGKNALHINADENGLLVHTKHDDINLKWSEIGFANLGIPNNLYIGRNSNDYIQIWAFYGDKTYQHLLRAISYHLYKANSSHLIVSGE